MTPSPVYAGLSPVDEEARRYSLGEEIASSVSHGVGALLGIAGLVLLIIFGVKHGGGLRVIAAVMMGVPLILEFLFSTLYHALTPKAAKSVFRVLDHCAIYLLIAGSYAPFALITLGRSGGPTLLAIEWALAIAGIVAEAFLRERQAPWTTTLVYLAMGWLVVLRLPILIEALPAGALWLLIAGGLCYTVGVGFYLAKKVPYLHFVWHLFVLAGSICITLSALIFVV